MFQTIRYILIATCIKQLNLSSFEESMNKTLSTTLILSLFLFAFICGPTKRKEVEGPVIGIDLGTTYSCVGIFKNGRVEIIPNEFGNRITPSFVAWSDEERLVGESAKNQAHINPKRSVYVVKRLIGRAFEDKEVQRDMKWLPYDVVNKGGKPYIRARV